MHEGNKKESGRLLRFEKVGPPPLHNEDRHGKYRRACTHACTHAHARTDSVCPPTHSKQTEVQMQANSGSFAEITQVTEFLKRTTAHVDLTDRGQRERGREERREG